MATNNITSSKAPARRGSKPIQDAAIPMFQGDKLMEHANGQAGRLATIQAQAIAGISQTTTDDLLRKAGKRVRRGMTVRTGS